MQHARNNGESYPRFSQLYSPPFPLRREHIVAPVGPAPLPIAQQFDTRFVPLSKRSVAASRANSSGGRARRLPSIRETARKPRALDRGIGSN